MASVGQLLKIEKIKGDFKPGDTVVFDKVLLVDNGSDTTTIGEPYIKVLLAFHQHPWIVTAAALAGLLIRRTR